MSNQVAVFNPGANVPAFVKSAGVTAIGKALAGGSGQSGKRISVKGGVFRLINDGKEVAAIDDRHLDIVVVNAAPKVSRTYYAGMFDEANPAPPACWSADGEKPDASIAKPQCGTCAACPQNVKGSGQGESKACRYSQRLAVVLANDMEGDVMQLSLAATSIFGKAEGDNRPLQDYARYLTAQGVDPTMLVTRMRFDTKAATPKLFFKAMRWLTQDEFEMCQEKGASPEAVQAITMTVSQMDGVAPAAPSIPGSAPKRTAAAPAPAAEEAAEPPAPAPKPRRAAAAPAPAAEDTGEPTVRTAAPAPAAASGSIAATLAAWDDE
jgi:hypothetical protein